MEFLIFWLGCAAIVGVIGAKRGLGFWSWFQRSVFFSPFIAGIWVVATKVDDARLEQQELEGGSEQEVPCLRGAGEGRGHQVPTLR